MAKGNHTGKGGFQDRPQDRNNGGIPKGLREKYNTFREMVLDWASEPEKFRAWADSNKNEAYRLACSLMPKEITGEGGKPIKAEVIMLPPKND